MGCEYSLEPPRRGRSNYPKSVKKKGKRKVQGVPQSQTAALPRPKEEEETDKSKQAQFWLMANSTVCQSK